MSCEHCTKLKFGEIVLYMINKIILNKKYFLLLLIIINLIHKEISIKIHNLSFKHISNDYLINIIT